MINRGRCAAIIVLALIFTLFSGCGNSSKKRAEIPIEKLTFRNIPGITHDEIRAIEALRRKNGYFVYGINPTTEAFLGKDGDLDGYAVKFCSWLSDMFGIQFKPTYYQWGDLLRGLENHEVDFTGELMYTANPGKAII